MKSYLFILTALLMWVDLCDSCTQMSDRCKWTHRSGLSLCWWLAGCFWKIFSRIYGSIQFSSVAQSCLTLYYPMDCSTPGLPVHHQLPELTQTNVHWVSDAIQPSHPLSSPSPPAPNPSQHQGLFKWVSS